MSALEVRLLKLERSLVETPCPGCASDSLQVFVVAAREPPAPPSCQLCGRQRPATLLLNPYSIDKALP